MERQALVKILKSSTLFQRPFINAHPSILAADWMLRRHSVTSNNDFLKFKINPCLLVDSTWREKCTKKNLMNENNKIDPQSRINWANVYAIFQQFSRSRTTPLRCIVRHSQFLRQRQSNKNFTIKIPSLDLPSRSIFLATATTTLLLMCQGTPLLDLYGVEEEKEEAVTLCMIGMFR